MLVISLTSWITSVIINRRLKRHIKDDGHCPFGVPCIKYNEIETKNAAARVVKLLIENIKDDSEYKKSLRKLIETPITTDPLPPVSSSLQISPSHSPSSQPK